MSQVTLANPYIRISAPTENLGFLLTLLTDEYKNLEIEISNLEAQLIELLQKVKQLSNELSALIATGCPPSPKELAQIMVELDLVTNEVDQVTSKIQADLTRLQYLAISVLDNPSDKLSENTLQMLAKIEQQVKTSAKKLIDRADQMQEAMKAIAQTIEQLAHTACKEPLNEELLQQVVQALNQVEKNRFYTNYYK